MYHKKSWNGTGIQGGFLGVNGWSVQDILYGDHLTYEQAKARGWLTSKDRMDFHCFIGIAQAITLW